MTQLPQGEGVQWFCLQGRERLGPFTADQLTADITAGRFDDGLLVWRAGMPQWASAAAVPEFVALSHLLPGSASPPPLPPEATVRPDPTTWLLGTHDKGQKRYHQGRLIGSIDSFIFGVLSFIPVLGLIFAAMSIPVATKAIGKAKKGPHRYSGKGFAVAGLILSLTSLALYAALLLWAILK